MPLSMTKQSKSEGLTVTNRWGTTKNDRKDEPSEEKKKKSEDIQKFHYLEIIIAPTKVATAHRAVNVEGTALAAGDANPSASTAVSHVVKSMMYSHSPLISCASSDSGHASSL